LPPAVPKRGGAEMRRIVTFLVAAAVFCLFVPLVTAEKPDKPGGGGGGGGDKGGRTTTEVCKMSGDIQSIVDGTFGEVEVGVTVQRYGPKVDLWLSSALLQGAWAEWELTETTYSGFVRVLKKDGRLDFVFNKDGSDCRPIKWGDEPPYADDICSFELILDHGVYDRRADTDLFMGSSVDKYISFYPHGDQGGGPSQGYSGQLGSEQVKIDFEPYDD
jgi:hypothetical protein